MNNSIKEGLKAVSNEDEYALLQRLANNKDSKALDALYRIYHPRLAGFLRRMTQNEDTISELINEVMYSVWKYAHQFNNSSKVSTWIFTIAYREFCKALRKEKSRQNLINNVAEQKLIDDISEPTTEQSKLESNELILKALESLPEEQRMVIELRYFSGHSVKEISVIAACPQNTVKTRMFHARRKLRDVIEKLSEFKT